MSDHRKPVDVWYKRLPQKRGTKKRKFRLLKIELVPACEWKSLWEPCSTLFIPKVPLRYDSMNEYWETRFRIRVDGKWVGPNGQYRMFTKVMIRERYFR